MGRDAEGAKSQEDKKWDPHGGSCGGLLVHLLCQSACSGMPRSHLPSWKLDLPPSSFTQRRRRALEEEKEEEEESFGGGGGGGQEERESEGLGSRG